MPLRYTVHRGATINRESSAMNTVRPVRATRAASRLTRTVFGLLVWFVASIPANSTPAAPAADAEPATRFQRTVQYVQEAAPELRSDFAATALTSMANAYLQEAQLAREQAQRAGKYSHLWAWSANVDRYADQISLLLEDIELGLPVDLSLAGGKSLAITVADRTIIVSHPRLNDQSAFEQGILTAFCASNDCDQFAPDNGANEPIPVAAARIRPNWTFTAQGSLCAYRGITVQFDNARSMADSRRICEQLLQEIMALAEELAWQQRYAVTIEWERLVVHPIQHSTEQSVQINTLGDTVLVAIPMLYRSAGLLQQLIPWMRAQVNGQQGVNIELRADKYGWQTP